MSEPSLSFSIYIHFSQDLKKNPHKYKDAVGDVHMLFFRLRLEELQLDCFFGGGRGEVVVVFSFAM